ncbi:MAG: signal peptide peptidase SppA [Nitrospinaceae bacterium]
MLDRGGKCLANIVFLGVCLAAVSGCATINLGPSIAPLKEKVVLGKGPEKVLLLDIHGMISNVEKRSLAGFLIKLGMVERVREILRKAEEDDRIKALLVRINSPGGTVTSSDIIYHEIKSFKEKKKVRVYVSMLDLAASGGYYIAMAGDKIMAHPTTLTGSIGVIALKLNMQELFHKVGVGWEVVKSGDKKDFLSPFRPLTKEERRLFQDTIDSYHQRFLHVIAENRPGLDMDQIANLADGRVYNARQALDSQLIDKIGYMEDTLKLIEQELKISDPKVITYHRPGEYKSNIYSSLSGAPTINLVNINLGLDPITTSPNFMYLWMQ